MAGNFRNATSFLLIGLITIVAGCATTLKTGSREKGLASYYADRYHGKKTASGEHYDKNQMTGAHRTLPMGSTVKVTGSSGQSVIVRINDRGPFVKNRIIDVSAAAAKSLDFFHKGVDEVEVQVISVPQR